MKKTYEINTSPEIHERIERFLAMLHWNSCHGHSGIFAMPLDGDGQDAVTITPTPRFKAEVELISSVGYDVELAFSHSYSGRFEDTTRDNRWQVKTVPALLVDGIVKKQLSARGGDK